MPINAPSSLDDLGDDILLKILGKCSNSLDRLRLMQISPRVRRMTNPNSRHPAILGRLIVEIDPFAPTDKAVVLTNVEAKNVAQECGGATMKMTLSRLHEPPQQPADCPLSWLTQHMRAFRAVDFVPCTDTVVQSTEGTDQEIDYCALSDSFLQSLQHVRFRGRLSLSLWDLDLDRHVPLIRFFSHFPSALSRTLHVRTLKLWPNVAQRQEKFTQLFSGANVPFDQICIESFQGDVMRIFSSKVKGISIVNNVGGQTRPVLEGGPAGLRAVAWPKSDLKAADLATMFGRSRDSLEELSLRTHNAAFSLHCLNFFDKLTFLSLHFENVVIEGTQPSDAYVAVQGGGSGVEVHLPALRVLNLRLDVARVHDAVLINTPRKAQEDGQTAAPEAGPSATTVSLTRLTGKFVCPALVSLGLEVTLTHPPPKRLLRARGYPLDLAIAPVLRSFPAVTELFVSTFPAEAKEPKAVKGFVMRPALQDVRWDEMPRLQFLFAGGQGMPSVAPALGSRVLKRRAESIGGFESELMVLEPIQGDPGHRLGLFDGSKLRWEDRSSKRSPGAQRLDPLVFNRFFGDHRTKSEAKGLERKQELPPVPAMPPPLRLPSITVAGPRAATAWPLVAAGALPAPARRYTGNNPATRQVRDARWQWQELVEEGGRQTRVLATREGGYRLFDGDGLEIRPENLPAESRRDVNMALQRFDALAYMTGAKEMTQMTIFPQWPSRGRR